LEHHRTEQLVDHITSVSFAMLGLGPPVSELYASRSMTEPRECDGTGERRGQAKQVVTKA